MNTVTVQESRAGFTEYAVSVNAEMSAVLMQNVEDSWMQNAISYHLGWLDTSFQPLPPDKISAGGKKLRPTLAILCYLSAMESQAPSSDTQANLRRVIPLAAALELIHNYSLVHDDIEDEDQLRRGRPTLWSMFGKPVAINIGDCLHALAFRCLDNLRQHGFGSDRLWKLGCTLADTSVKLTLGQHSDLQFQDRLDVTTEMYLKMIGRKTAALISCATYCGAFLALDPSQPQTAERLKVYANYGHQLGIGFQIWDDVLGIWGLEAETGKPAGSDIRRRKKTLPILFGLANSPQREQFLDLYKRTDPMTAEGQQFVIKTLENCGAREYAEQKANSHKEQALKALARTAGDSEILNLNPALLKLSNLTSFMVDREH